jgi:hypothetical protein
MSRRIAEETDEIIANFRSRSRDINTAVAEIKRAQKALRAPGRFQIVPGKVVYQGKRGGMYYYNDSERKTYLTPGQCKRCKEGTLRFVSSGCPPKNPDKKACQPTRPKLKKKVRKLKQQ